MSGVNKVIIVGRLGKDPEVRNLDNGAQVANFSVAVSETWKDKTTGEKKESTEWVNIVLWRALAEIAGKYLKKGDMVYIEGKLATRSWEKDGVTRYTTEVVGNDMVMLTPKGSGSSREQAPPPSEEPRSNGTTPKNSSAQSGSNSSGSTQAPKQQEKPAVPTSEPCPWEEGYDEWMASKQKSGG